MHHYRLNFFMIYSKVFSLSELDEMIPWEREVYSHLLAEQLQKEKEELENAQKRS